MESPGPNTELRRATIVLAALVVARFLFHAFYVPVFEGPDEPFHLSRAVNGPSTSDLGMPIANAVRAHPCAPDLQRALGCRPFAGDGAFNIVGPRASRELETTIQNYEMHQPPLYYATAGLLYRIARGARWSPERQLLALRLLSVGFAALALILWSRTSKSAIVFFVPLLLPGAAESLARASNDAFLFAWSASIWIAVEKKSRGVILLAALGPLIKLTAFPVIAAAAALLWLQRRRSLGVATAVASLLVFPIQALRGWAWGGTLEVNLARGEIAEGLGAMAIGLARSLYTFAKTTFWLGEWSFFRAPLWLVGSFFLILLAIVLSARPKPDRQRWIAHALGVAVAAAGLLMFAVLNRKLFGTWGGVGGWYAWGWYPWLAALSLDLAQMRPRARILARAFVVFVVVSNVAWFLAATRLYGF